MIIGVPYEATTAAQITSYGGEVVVGTVNVLNYSVDVFGGSNETQFMARDALGSMRNLYGSAVAGRGNVTGKDSLDVLVGAPNAGGKYGSVFLWRYVAY